MDALHQSIDYVFGGCSSTACKMRRKFTTPSRLSFNLAMVALPIGVKPINMA